MPAPKTHQTSVSRMDPPGSVDTKQVIQPVRHLFGSRQSRPAPQPFCVLGGCQIALSLRIVLDLGTKQPARLRVSQDRIELTLEVPQHRSPPGALLRKVQKRCNGVNSPDPDLSWLVRRLENAIPHLPVLHVVTTRAHLLHNHGAFSERALVQGAENSGNVVRVQRIASEKRVYRTDP